MKVETIATITPEIVMPMTNVSRRVGVSQLGSSVPASISIRMLNATLQKPADARPSASMPRNR